jgi:hypothetical protein
MPGPLGATGPTLDPNWAWDTQGWTNQGNLGGDVEGQNLNPSLLSANTYLTEPESLSGYVGRSMDPAVNSAGAANKQTPSVGVLYLAAMEILAPAVTSKYVVSVATAGTTTSSVFQGLYNNQGALVASNTAVGTIAATTISRTWTTPAVLSPGLYYGAWLTGVAGAQAAQFYGTAISAEQSLLSGTTWPGTTFRFLSTGSSLAALPASLATGFTGSGTVASYGFAWFFGIA